MLYKTKLSSNHSWTTSGLSPSDLMKSSYGVMKVCLIQHMFCSRESANYLMIQQDEKSTQKKKICVVYM